MTPLTPAVVTALAQQAAESPAHLDPVLVHQVCQEWQIGQQAASLQRCIVEAAYQDKVKAEQQRDAALAERDALREQLRLSNIDQCNAEAELSMQQQFTTSAESAFIACKAALTEARRVLKHVLSELKQTDDWGVVSELQAEIAAVLAQEEK